jgi:transmembrane sensor
MSTGLPDAVVDAAIGWSVKLDHGDPTPAARAAFERWLGADPQHGLAWARVAAMRGDLQRVPPRLALDTLQSAESSRRTRATGRRKLLQGLGLGFAGLVSIGAVREFTPWQRLVADVSTGVGERRTVTLSDGTRLALNTDTAVGADLAGDRRVLVLHRGEILVTTGPDAGARGHREFWVETSAGRLRAVGTRFIVRLDGARTFVGVTEGAVDLHPAGGGPVVRVAAGASRWLDRGGTAPAEPRGFDPDAFADGVIAGRDMRLADLLAELSRHRHGRLVCDPRVADLRVSGVFHLDDTDQVLRFIARTQPVEVTRRTRFWITVGPVSKNF